MQLFALPDIAGANAAVALGTALQARFLKVSVVGSGTVRLGDISVTAARGVAIVAASGVVDIELDGSDPSELFQVASHYAYVPTGTTLTVSAGVG